MSTNSQIISFTTASLGVGALAWGNTENTLIENLSSADFTSSQLAAAFFTGLVIGATCGALIHRAFFSKTVVQEKIVDVDAAESSAEVEEPIDPQDLLKFAKTGQLDEAKALLAKEVNPSTVIDSTNGKNALHYAAEAGNHEFIKVLTAQEYKPSLQEGTTIPLYLDAKDKDGCTPIHYALVAMISADAKTKTVKTLGEAGASLDIPCGKDNKTAQQWIDTLKLKLDIKSIRRPDTAETKEEEESITAEDETKFFNFASAGNVKEFTALLNKDIDPTIVRGAHGHNVLHIAAINGQVEIIKLLGEWRAKKVYREGDSIPPFFDAGDRYHNTPLHVALTSPADVQKKEKIVEILVKYSNLSLKDKNSETAKQVHDRLNLQFKTFAEKKDTKTKITETLGKVDKVLTNPGKKSSKAESSETKDKKD